MWSGSPPGCWREYQNTVATAEDLLSISGLRLVNHDYHGEVNLKIRQQISDRCLLRHSHCYDSLSSGRQTLPQN